MSVAFCFFLKICVQTYICALVGATLESERMKQHSNQNTGAKEDPNQSLYINFDVPINSCLSQKQTWPKKYLS